MIYKIFRLGFQWPTQEPFLFCVHHLDKYPAGNAELGPDANLLKGRDLGMDFQEKDGFRMYHGDVVPGFPVHPHRGFETVTIARNGMIDHADSLGAAGRYGGGDVQWMTAGRGVQHSEMFPLLNSKSENPVELFQIWLNLPKKNKMVEPHFSMFWSEKIPKIYLDEKKVEIVLIAGEMFSAKALTPPPGSWASEQKNEVLIFTAKIKMGGRFVVPKSLSLTNRTMYFFAGEALLINGHKFASGQGFYLDGSVDLEIESIDGLAEVLMLQAKPIGEPVAQHGPFVMNSRDEIVQAIDDYRRTEFGGWPWDRDDMIHGKEAGRFAKFPDGRMERPD
jgi:quercetin 2,3-dioxygenase